MADVPLNSALFGVSTLPAIRDFFFTALTTQVPFFEGAYSHPSDPVRELHEGETGHDKSKDIYISPPLRYNFLHAAKMLLLGDILTVVARIPF